MNKFSLSSLVLIMSTVMCAPALAQPHPLYSFDSPTGQLGPSQTYSAPHDGRSFNVTAYGFDCVVVCESGVNYSPTELWATSGAGLGIASDPDHRISTTNFIQFDLAAIRAGALGVDDPRLPITWTFTEGTRFIYYASNTLGALGQAWTHSDVTVEHKPLSMLDEHRYWAFSAWQQHDPGARYPNWGFRGPSDLSTGPDFTIQSLSIAVIPEPEIYALMLAGLGLLGFVARRKKRQAAAA